MPPITAIVDTYNEEDLIEECIRSLHNLTDTVIVVDSGSTDTTIEKARRLNATIFEVPRSYYVEPIRQYSVEQVKSGWVCILDADERMTPELANEIKTVISNQSATYYKIPRKNIFAATQWLKHGGWWPDHQIRLFQKEAFQSWPQKIHSTPHIQGDYGYLEHPILHYIHRDMSSMVEKSILFEAIEADLLYKANRPVKTATFFRKFIGELYRRLIRHGGFMDGPVGIIESIYQAYSKTITYLYLYEKHESSPL